MMSPELERYTIDLKSRKLLPKKFDFSRFNEWHLISAYSIEDDLAISEQVSMGIDLNFDIAYAKALTEYQERNLLNGIHHFSFDLHEKSDGVAAFPTRFANANKKVRGHAYNEAVERFLWANWWDNSKVRFDLFDTSELPYLRSLKDKFNLEKIYSIYVKHKQISSAEPQVDLHILLAKNFEGGYVTGGAAGKKEERLEVFNRSFGELLRHLVVYETFKKGKKPISFYEKRLWGFASGEWADLVDKRLSVNGILNLELPKLIVDETIPHPNDDIVLIHRNLFQGQPLFVGGDIKRLCL